MSIISEMTERDHETIQRLRGELAARGRLIEQLAEALEVALNPAEWDDDPQGQGQEALVAYQRWKEGIDAHQG